MSNHVRSEDGSVIVGVIIMLFIAFALIGSYLALSANDARLTRIAIDEEKAFIVAEAGLDYGVMKLRDVLIQYQLSPMITEAQLEQMIDNIPPPEGLDEYQYISPTGAPAFRIEIASSLDEGVINDWTSCRGSYGAYQHFTIVSGCINTGTQCGAVLKQTVQAVGLPLIRFGVFYEGGPGNSAGAEDGLLRARACQRQYIPELQRLDGRPGVP